MVASWARPAFVRTLQTARLHFVVMSEALGAVTIDPRVDGAPPREPLPPLDVRSRAEPDFLARMRSRVEQATGSYGQLDRAAVARSAMAVQILLEEPDPCDLIGLQAALSLVHAIAREPFTTAVIDMITGAVWSRHAFAALPGDRPFDPEEHIVRILVPSMRSANTRGLVKFARPDLLIEDVEPYHQPAARALLRIIAEALANGVTCDGRRTMQLPIGPGAPFEITFLPPRPELETETWGNTYFEIRALDRAGPPASCFNLLEAVDRMMRSLSGAP